MFRIIRRREMVRVGQVGVNQHPTRAATWSTLALFYYFPRTIVFPVIAEPGRGPALETAKPMQQLLGQT